MDNTYHDRMLLRQKLINDHLAATVQTNPVSAPAVLELYTWLTTTYLPTRFPSIYTLHPTTLHNSASNTSLPLTPSTPTAALRLLGEHIDTDFLILLPKQPRRRRIPNLPPRGVRDLFPIRLQSAGETQPAPSLDPQTGARVRKQAGEIDGPLLRARRVRQGVQARQLDRHD